MIPSNNPYNTAIPDIDVFTKISPQTILKQLREYLDSFKNCFVRSQQIRYFETFIKGLLSKLDRKSIEPIALSFLGEKEVRGMQQFFSRSSGWYDALSRQYKQKLSMTLNDPEGFISVDESDFVKKGKDSVGVARQYCGRLGKTDNCQAGVFINYASQLGIGLIDSRLYIPKAWFGEDYQKKREQCQIPDDVTFKTKNQIAKKMIADICQSQLFDVKYIGCDAAFGSDHTFLDSLPDTVSYFACVRENEYIFLERPQVFIPEIPKGKAGGRFKHPRAAKAAVAIKSIMDNDAIPWQGRIISEGSKGPIIADIKSIRCVSCRKENRLFMPKSDIWVYIRKHEDGTIKYFISNLPADTSMEKLDRLATARWSIEQCFKECKSNLGMAHYETRTYKAWHRHMLLVMIAHLFVTIMRLFFKRTHHTNNALDQIHHRFSDTHLHIVGGDYEDSPISLAAKR